MPLAPLAAALNTVLTGLPLAVTEELDPGAVDEQVQRPFGAAIRDLDSLVLLAAAQGRIVWDVTVQAGQTQQVGNGAPIPLFAGLFADINLRPVVRKRRKSLRGRTKEGRFWPGKRPARPVDP